MEMIIDRNSKKEIELDIVFIDEIIEYLNNKDFERVKKYLSEWKLELQKKLENKEN